MRILRSLTLACALTALLVGPLRAQTRPEPEFAPGPYTSHPTHRLAFGVRAGYTNWDNISQMHFGAHLKMGEVYPNLDFTPNIEAGFGDDVSIITFSGDLTYNFTEWVARPWNVYGGGSLSFNYVEPDGFDSQTDLGLSALLGLERTFANDRQGMVEMRVGIMDSPDFKLTFGYTLF